MFSKTIQNLIDHFSRFPGIGPRQAQRAVFYMLKLKKDELKEFAESINMLSERIELCSVCFVSYETPDKDINKCPFCSDTKRNKTIMCIVEKETDINPIEITGVFKGIYHVVGEHIDVIEKKVPYAVQRLLDRIAFIKKQIPKNSKYVMEVILATNITVEGEELALYLERLIYPLDVKITRFGRGMASGSELEYADKQTLIHAFETRKSG